MLSFNKSNNQISSPIEKIPLGFKELLAEPYETAGV